MTTEAAALLLERGANADLEALLRADKSLNGYLDADKRLREHR